MKKIIVMIVITSMLVGCANNQGQNRYNASEAGKAVEVEYAKVLSVKKVAITGENTGIGGVAGGLAGGIAAGGNMGQGGGALIAAIAGAVIGGVVGSIAEQELQNTVGYEYRIKVDGEKKAKSIVQNQHKDDVVFKKGDRVIVQLQGDYQRIVEAD
jgi:outer membrane lipoprotein SlyB